MSNHHNRISHGMQFSKQLQHIELLALIRSLSRRDGGYAGEILSFEDLSLNKGTMELRCGSNSIPLGLKEAMLMELLMNNPRQIIPKPLLIEKVWGIESNAEYNNIEVYISFLRQKIQSLETLVQIKTIRGLSLPQLSVFQLTTLRLRKPAAGGGRR